MNPQFRVGGFEKYSIKNKNALIGSKCMIRGQSRRGAT